MIKLLVPKSRFITIDEIFYNFNSMTFKQKYIHEKGPFPFNFEEERIDMFQKIINLLQQYDRNMWTVSSFNFGSML